MFEKDSSLLGKLMDYGKSDAYPFHMPGHKRRDLGDFPNPYQIDITEIDGFDNLHHAEGILKESMKKAAEIYGADHTYYLVNGSTCGILSSICACTKPGDGILIARNCHKSAFHGMMLQNLKPHYLYPEHLHDFGINGCVSPKDVEMALSKNPDIQAVLIVSPTYEGIVSDVQAIADIAHRYRIPLIVDEAHGAHFSFAEHGFPKSAIACGADFVIQSIHKTLPAFTQTALLHVNNGLIDLVKLERYLGMFQTSSPSYVFLSAIEQCILYMDQVGRSEMKVYEKRLRTCYQRLKDLKVLKVLSKEQLNESVAFDWDMSKVVVSTSSAKMSGETFSNLLRKKYHLEMEMSGPEYIVGITTLMDTEEGLNRLMDAFLEIDRDLAEHISSSETSSDVNSVLAELPKAAPVFTLSDAVNGEGKQIDLWESEGEISQEFLYLYPPGIPILAPGERITKEILDRVAWYMEKGLLVQGLADPTVSSIITVAEE